MSRYAVSLQKHSRRVACCGAATDIRTWHNLGTIITVDHGYWCRVGRVLDGRWSHDMDRPGFEPAPTDDRHQLRIAKR